jgi:hypothetical protein
MVIRDKFPRPGARLRALPFVDKSFFFARAVTGTVYIAGQTNTLITPKLGQVHVITKIVCWLQAEQLTSPGANPSNDALDLLWIDPAGTTRETLSIFAPDRLLGAGALQANNDASFTWEPSMPLIVPVGWKVSVTAHSGAATTQGASIMAFGFKMDPAEAVANGLNVDGGVFPAGSADFGNSGAATTAPTQANRQWIQTGAILNAGVTRLVAGKAGYGIEITDILCRFSAISGTNTSVELRKTDGTPIFRWVQTAVTGDVVHKQIKCSIFLDPLDGGSPIAAGTASSPNAVTNAYGQQLQGNQFSYGIDVSVTNLTSRGSIILIGRYVRWNEIPNDAWWVNVQGGFATANLSPPINRPIKTAPGKGRRHIIQGVDFSAGKDSTAPSTGQLYSLVTTAAAAPTGSISEIGQTVTLRNITPPFVLKSQNQQTNFTIDDVEMPCPDNWLIFSSFQGDPFSTPPADGDMIDSSVTVWGRTDWSVTRGSTEADQATGG